MEANKVRIDKWLWAARFFKTRSLASQAVAGGHVQVNGERVKPARNVQVGDRLLIRRAEEIFSVSVLALAEKRGPASAARLLYQESEESIAARQQASEERKLQNAGSSGPAGRPGKRDRRLIRDFIRKS